MVAKKISIENYKMTIWDYILFAVLCAFMITWVIYTVSVAFNYLIGGNEKITLEKEFNNKHPEMYACISEKEPWMWLNEFSSLPFRVCASDVCMKELGAWTHPRECINAYMSYDPKYWKIGS